jgi:serine/threonine protein kinase
MFDSRLYDNVHQLRPDGPSYIYTARDRRTNTTVFLKAPRSFGCTENDVEFQILKDLNHQSIIQCKGITMTPNGTALVLPYYPDCDLSDLLVQKGRLSEAEVKVILVQMLKALAYLHSRHTIHRDIKPDNIYWTSGKSKVVVLADFGFACRVPESGKVKGRRGSSHYVPPEMSGSYSEKVDIWPLGVTAAVLLVGHFLYDARDMNTTIEVFEQVIANLPKELESLGVSNGCIELLLKMLVIDPEQRISAAEALNDNWFKEEEGLEEDVQTEGILDEPFREAEKVHANCTQNEE